jgi:hypothetical protein
MVERKTQSLEHNQTKPTRGSPSNITTTINIIAWHYQQTPA